jgi:hypothetical protein
MYTLCGMKSDVGEFSFSADDVGVSGVQADNRVWQLRSATKT